MQSVDICNDEQYLNNDGVFCHVYISLIMITVLHYVVVIMLRIEIEMMALLMGNPCDDDYNEHIN